MNRQPHLRHFNVALELRDFDGPGDGRTVFGRVVPYGEVIEFFDHADHKRKREVFEYGALAAISRAWHRVLLSFEHLDGIDNMIGYGRSVVESADGADATFRLYRDAPERAVEMMQTSHRGMSMEFYPIVDGVRDDGTIVRRQVHVSRVSIVTDPAYVGARVMALRSAGGADNLDHEETADTAAVEFSDPAEPVVTTGVSGLTTVEFRSGTPLLDQVLADMSTYQAERLAR